VDLCAKKSTMSRVIFTYKSITNQNVTDQGKEKTKTNMIIN